MSSDMAIEPPTRSCPAYWQLQGNRCQRLSRSCMDLATARDLRLMAEEYFVEASRLEGDPRRENLISAREGTPCSQQSNIARRQPNMAAGLAPRSHRLKPANIAN